MAGKSFEEIFEQSLFRSRWFMAPFYVGLIIALIVLMITFGKEVVEETKNVLTLELDENKVVSYEVTTRATGSTATVTLKAQDGVHSATAAGNRTPALILVPIIPHC